MKKLYSIIGALLITVMIFGAVNLTFADGKALNEDEKAAFIVREEWDAWVAAFTASLSEFDRLATAKIYANMDFYDMQYRFTEKYKTKQYLDDDGKPTDELKNLIKEKRKELNRNK